MRKIYYNEFDKYAVQWLKNLITEGLLPDGEIDNRNILDVRADELREFNECHFFAGIGGWPYAMRLANLQSDGIVWTGSCPCQPFSVAGKQKGEQDDRHLWPVWFKLIKDCKPSIIFGEQVASAVSFGWFDLVANDLEKENYQVGAAILPACSVGAPHKRDRLWFVAIADIQQSHGYREGENRRSESANSSIMGDSDNARLQGRELFAEYKNELHAWSAGVEWIKCADGKQRLVKSGICLLANGIPARVGKLRAYGNAIVPQTAERFIRASVEALGLI